MILLKEANLFLFCYNVHLQFVYLSTWLTNKQIINARLYWFQYGNI